MSQFLVFHRNTITGEDFTTPVEADSAYDAQQQLNGRYPQPAYLYLTCFEKTELQGILDDAERWPGVASKPQPTLEQLLQRVTAGVGRLPPLPGRQATQATEAKVQTTTGYGQGRLNDSAKVAAFQQAQAFQQAAKPAPRMAETKPANPLMAKANQGRSVIDVLRALKS